jgi:hypothetical protein
MRTPIALVAALLVASPVTAVAQEPRAVAVDSVQTPDELIAKGIELRKRGADAEALAVFQRAYALHPCARAAAQIGLAQQALGHWREAETGLLEALRGSADDTDAEWMARNRVYLDQSLAAVQSHLGWLQVDSNLAGAEVWIAGELGGRVPLDRPIRVVAGEVPLEARASGLGTVQQTVHVEAGAQARAVLTYSSPPMVESRAPHDEPTPTLTDSGRRTAGWFALGGAAGLLLIGVAAQVTREWEAHIYNDDGQCGPMGSLTRYERCGTNRDIGSVAESIALGAYAGAAVAAVTAGVLLFTGSRRASASTTGHAACWVAGDGIRCGGRF